MIVKSLVGLIQGTDFTMTETKILLENWEHENITFKALNEKGFQLPKYRLWGN
jgi:hypothetical protein